MYFCCLEAMQNAGKHAGEGAEITVTVVGRGRLRSRTADGDTQGAGVLRFTVHDDGAGFDVGAGGAGHGFVNMRDRLGAIGGELAIASTPGAGATVTGIIPLELTSAEQVSLRARPRPDGPRQG